LHDILGLHFLNLRFANCSWYSAAPQPQEAELTEAVKAQRLATLHSILDDRHYPQIYPENEKDKALSRQFYIEAMKSRRSKLEVLWDNIGNPVVVGNAVLAIVFSAGLGFEAYQGQIQGQLSWNIIGLGAGLVGLTAGVSYFISK
jgi:hypothetical protein